MCVSHHHRHCHHHHDTFLAADEAIRLLIADGTLQDAIADCIFAAGMEFFPGTQQALMGAASFGKNFDDKFDGDEFVRMCRGLRVLNQLRYFTVRALCGVCVCACVCVCVRMCVLCCSTLCCLRAFCSFGMCQTHVCFGICMCINGA